MKRYGIILVVGLLGLSGCAGISASQMGQTAGTIAGAAIAPGIGAPVGALVGLLAGMVVQGQVDKATETRERRELGAQLESRPVPTSTEEPPSTGQPIRVWIDEMMQEGRRVAGHFDVRYLP